MPHCCPKGNAVHIACEDSLGAPPTWRHTLTKNFLGVTVPAGSRRSQAGSRFPLLVPVLIVLCLCGCKSAVETNASRLGQVKINPDSSGVSRTSDPTKNAAGPPPESGVAEGPSMHEGDMATMDAVANGCLKAWRKACSGDKKESLAMLNDLDKHYPGILTIQMMLGQVYEHFGDKKEAIEHYRRAVTGNEFSSYHVFKLAEAMRKNSDYKGAAAYYRKVIKNAPGFGSAKLGLAKCLLATDKQSGEARNLLSEAAQDEQSGKEAKDLLNQLEPAAAAGN